MRRRYITLAFLAVFSILYTKSSGLIHHKRVDLTPSLNLMQSSPEFVEVNEVFPLAPAVQIGRGGFILSEEALQFGPFSLQEVVATLNSLLLASDVSAGTPIIGLTLDFWGSGLADGTLTLDMVAEHIAVWTTTEFGVGVAEATSFLEIILMTLGIL